MRTTTGLIHVKTGWPVVISQGISDKGWSIYIQKPNRSLKRCKQFEIYPTPMATFEALNKYKGKAFKSK